MKTIYFAIFLMLFLFSCGNKTNSAVDEDSTDSDTISEGQTQPEDSFFERETDNTFVFDFKGLVNSEADISTQKAISGIGDFTFYFGSEKFTLEGDENCYEKKYADDYSESTMAGKEFLQLTVYSMKNSGVLDNGNQYYTYDYLSMGLSVEEVMNLKKSGENELEMPELSWATLYEYFVVVRADSRYFMQYCPRSSADSTHSQFFVNYDNNDSFAAGENMIFWGNIALSEPITITDENRAESCLFFDSDGNTITNEEFDAEIAKTGTEFSCEIPGDFFDKNGEDYLKFKFRGQINGEENPTTGYTEFAEMEIGEELYHAGNYTAGAGLTTVVSRKTLYVQMVGDYNLIDSTTAEYNELQMFAPVSTLEDMKRDNIQEITYNSDSLFNFLSVFLRTKYKEVDGKGYVKSCPIGLLDKDSLTSKLFICIDEDSEFTEGNEIEIAGRIAVTNDTEKMAVYYSDNGCTCYASAGDEEITCDDFAAMEE